MDSERRPTYSVLVPFLPYRPEQILPYAALVSHTQAHRLWQGQALVVEPHQGLAYAAAVGFRVPVGLGVGLMGLRHPYEAALQARSLAVVTGHPVVAGFGPGGRSFQRMVRHDAYGSPLKASREYLTAARQALDGEFVRLDGEYVAFRGKLIAAPAPRVDLGLGVLRPGMARLAGEVADVAITWLTPASYLKRTVVPAMREGASAMARPVPHLTAIVPMALARPERDPVELALASNGAHLQAPHYRAMLRRAGAAVSAGDDLAAAAKVLIECGAFLNGVPEQLAQMLAEYVDAGVDEIVINVTGVCARYGQRAALAELQTLLEELE